jgi:hypothetical protein
VNQSTCTVDQCARETVAKGLCKIHYYRKRRNGHTGLQEKRTAPSIRFWAKVSRGDDGECWNWLGSKNALGYGKFYVGTVGGRAVLQRAHRFSYEETVGPIPDSLVIDHLCRNASCVNPAHLEPVTNRENLVRGVGFVGVNTRTTHCPAGHEYTPENTLTWTRSDGRVHRKCRECDRTRVRDKYRREHEVPECQSSR